MGGDSCWAAVAMVTGSQRAQQHADGGFHCSREHECGFIGKLFAGEADGGENDQFFGTWHHHQTLIMTVTIATENTEFLLAGEFALFSVIKKSTSAAGRLLVSAAPRGCSASCWLEVDAACTVLQQNNFLFSYLWCVLRGERCAPTTVHKRSHLVPLHSLNLNHSALCLCCVFVCVQVCVCTKRAAGWVLK